jgi:hypothetical protein
MPPLAVEVLGHPDNSIQDEIREMSSMVSVREDYKWVEWVDGDTIN